MDAPSPDNQVVKPGPVSESEEAVKARADAMRKEADTQAHNAAVLAQSKAILGRKLYVEHAAGVGRNVVAPAAAGGIIAVVVRWLFKR